MRDLFFVVVVIAVSAGALYGLAHDDRLAHEPGDSRSTAYLTEVAQLGQIRETVSASGTIEAVVTVEVGSQISGLIDKLFVDFNEFVKKGQPLAEIDQQRFLAHFEEAKAALETAQAEANMQRADVLSAEIGIRDAHAQIPVLQARLERALADLAAADANFRRIAELQKRKIASGKDYDEAKARRAIAAAEIREAEAIIAAQKEKIAAAEAELDRARAELANALGNISQKQALMKIADVDLQRTIIRSPIDGIVINRGVESGQTVAAQLEAPTLFTIAQDLREMQVKAWIDETDIGQIKIGQQALFSVDAYPGQNFEGEVIQIRKSPELTENVVTYTVVIRTQNPKLLLLPGMTADIEIVVIESEELLKIPSAALSFSPGNLPSTVNASRMTDKKRQKPDQAVVWKLDHEGRPSPAQLRLGHRDTNSVEVLDGPLQEGDQVIVSEVTKTRGKRLFGIRIGF